MRGISFWFFLVATICVTLGMAGGIFMSATHDHTLGPVHGHLNLVGWVTMALFGGYYHMVPQAGLRLMARIHFVLATAGVVIMVPGIAMAILHGEPAGAAIGSILTMASMLIFLGTVVYDRRALRKTA